MGLMGLADISAEHILILQNFFSHETVKRGTKPLKKGIELALFIDSAGPLTLKKEEEKISVESAVSKSPDMTFTITSLAVASLEKMKSDDLGETGIEICKLLLSSDPKCQLKAKVHIGTWDLLRHGYLGILPLGGSTLMKFLATRGFGNIGKIKDAISRLKG